MDTCAYFSDTLLKSCPYLKLLATSRESLGITGEALDHVPSLGFPHLQHLDGIPLTIELVAAKVGMFSTDQIAKQLDESFNLLTGGSSTAAPAASTRFH